MRTQFWSCTRHDKGVDTHLGRRLNQFLFSFSQKCKPLFFFNTTPLRFCSETRYWNEGHMPPTDFRNVASCQPSRKQLRELSTPSIKKWAQPLAPGVQPCVLGPATAAATWQSSRAGRRQLDQDVCAPSCPSFLTWSFINMKPRSCCSY